MTDFTRVKVKKCMWGQINDSSKSYYMWEISLYFKKMTHYSILLIQKNNYKLLLSIRM